MAKAEPVPKQLPVTKMRGINLVPFPMVSMVVSANLSEDSIEWWSSSSYCMILSPDTDMESDLIGRIGGIVKVSGVKDENGVTTFSVYILKRAEITSVLTDQESGNKTVSWNLVADVPPSPEVFASVDFQNALNELLLVWISFCVGIGRLPANIPNDMYSRDRVGRFVDVIGGFLNFHPMAKDSGTILFLSQVAQERSVNIRLESLLRLYNWLNDNAQTQGRQFSSAGTRTFGKENGNPKLPASPPSVNFPDNVREAIEKARGKSKSHSMEGEKQGEYVEWLESLPWSTQTKDPTDLVEAQRILDEDHFGLDKVKERVLEQLATNILNPDGKAPILCFIGPPGVGKTSLGKSIARAMGRKFVNLRLG